MAKKIEPRCIICGKEKDGIEVKEDYVIDLIRWFNRTVLKRVHHYKIVVCKDCYMDYTKARKKYTKRQGTYIAIGVIFALLLFFASGFNVFALFYGAGIIIFMYVLSLFSYVPELQVNEQIKASPAKK